MSDPEYMPEINWRDLIKNPAKLFGYSYLYFLLMIILLGLLYVANLGTIGNNAVTPTNMKDSAAMSMDIPLQHSRTVPPVDVLKVAISSSAMIEKGHELYNNNCVSCHGENGLGDGLSASMLNPKPRNFHELTGWKNGSKITQIYKTLQEGVPGSSMSSYEYLIPNDRFALIHYIRTFADHQPQDSPDDLRQLDVAYNLSKGMNIVGQIPIRKAIQIVANEIAIARSNVQNSIHEHSVSKIVATELLNGVMHNEQKVFISFTHMQKTIKNENDFAKIITTDPILYGFKPNVVFLSHQDWRELYQYLNHLSQGKHPL